MRHASIPPKACARCDRPASRGDAARALVLIGLLAGSVAWRAAAGAAAAWPAETYNPQPAKDDVVLPMPCGGAMAFRKVMIPSEGALSDRLIRVGATDGDRGYLEGARPAHVAGSFSDGEHARYYLIGKYEISHAQYDAVSEKCTPLTADARLPQTDVGWIDAVNFADRYTLWLLRNAKDTLPAEEHEPGFVRLPTEDEWEFAARGGVAVSESDFQDVTFPMTGSINEYVWFAGPQSANGKVQRIGLLKPNPLGIHDILGNVDEMVLDPFRLNKLDRLHGQAGGFIVRGGNYATAEDDVRTAYRQEIPYYQGQEARRSPTTGFRLVISRSRRHLTQPPAADRRSVERARRVGPDCRARRHHARTGAQPLADPIEELAAIAAAASDANMKQRLKNVQIAFRASFQDRDEQRDRAAKARLRLGTFLCQKLKDDGLPLDRLKKVHEACVASRGADDARCKAERADVDADEMTQWNNLRYYADTIVTLVEDYPDGVVAGQLALLKKELGARDDLKPLAPVADLYARHAAQFRKERTIPRAAWLADCKGLQ